MNRVILVSGANGQLGMSLQKVSPDFPFSFLWTDVDTLNLSDSEALEAYLSAHKVDYWLNCAAYTAVDKAEDEPELCAKINVQAVENIARSARKYGIKVIHISTDYVFDGKGPLPYKEEDPTAPASIYGSTKREGERALSALAPDSVILRTAWLYSSFGSNFVKTMLRLGREREILKVVFDQIGTPTYAGDLAEAMLQIVALGEQGRWTPGIYHYSNEGVCSWFDFTIAILDQAGIKACKVVPVESVEYPTKAVRPFYSVLNKNKIKQIYGLIIPYWRESLARCMKELL